MRRQFLAAIASIALVVTASPGIALARSPSSKTVKIGVLTDMSGVYASIAGSGEVAAAKLAIADFGGTALGKPVQLVSADTQVKPSVSSTIARKWIDEDGVDMIVGITDSAIGLSTQYLATKTHTIFMYTGASSTQMTNKGCSKYGIQYMYNTYSLAAGTARSLVKRGGKTWYFITVNYAFGHSLQKNATQIIDKMGGKVLGSVSYPLGTNDFSSYLLGAKDSGADVIGLANAGLDLVNSIKQARTFGITQGGQKLAALLGSIMTVKSVGLNAAQGIQFTTAFYWNRNKASRAFSKRFFAKQKAMPSQQQAATYSAVLSYLKAVKVTGTDNASKVRAELGKMTINDAVIQGGHILPNGEAPHTMFLVQAKTPSQSTGPWDLLRVVSSIPANDAFLPLSASSCPLVH